MPHTAASRRDADVAAHLGEGERRVGGGDLDEDRGVVAAAQQPAARSARQIVGGGEAEHGEHAERVDDDAGGGVGGEVLQRDGDEDDRGDEAGGDADRVHASVGDDLGPGVAGKDVFAHARVSRLRIYGREPGETCRARLGWIVEARR